MWLKHHGAVKEYLEKLRAKGVVRRIGKTSGNYWEIKTRVER